MTREHIEVGGAVRTFHRIVPAAPASTAPLLVVLHGTGQTGRSTQGFGGHTFTRLAARIGAEVLYLDGYRRAWNDARRIRTSAAQKRGMDDVGFVEAVVRRSDRPTIAIGYSNGGQLLHRLLRESPGVVQGAVLVAAGLPVDDDFLLAGTRPQRLPVLLLHGTADPIVPYAGGPTRMLGRTLGTVRSAVETARGYAGDEDPTVVLEGEIERRDWDGVRLITQVGAGHVIPNRSTAPARFVVGPSHHDLDAGEEVESFFALAPAVR